MAIMPVSAVNAYQNNIINFQGKKNKESNLHSSTSSPMLKAVPLAVLIAMSPINAQSINNTNNIDYNNNNIEYVEMPANSLIVSNMHTTTPKDNILGTKEFFERDKAGTSEGVPVYGEFKLINSDKNKNNFESIRLRVTRDYFDNGNKADFEGTIVGYSQVNFTIIGEDGVPVSKASFNQIILKDDKTGYNIPISRPEMCGYMETLLSSPNNNTGIKKNVINRNLRPSPGGGLQNVAPDTSWYQKAKERDEYFGSEIMSAKVQGTFGNYTLRAYNMNNDKSNFERMTIQKDGGPELIVNKLKQVNDKCFNYGYIGNIVYHQLDVSRRNLGTHAIIDPKLFESLKSVVGLEKFNNAFEVQNVDETTIVDENAIVADLD